MSKSKVVVISIRPGESVQVGQTAVRVRRWRDGKAVLELTGPEDIHRNIFGSQNEEAKEVAVRPQNSEQIS